MNYVEIIITIMISLSFVTAIRIYIGPTIWDRILYFNFLSSKMLIILTLFAVLKKKTYLLDISILYALLGYISICFIARFVQRKGEI